MANTPTTDLTDIWTESVTGWTELSLYGAGAAPVVDTEVYIQGLNCVSQQVATNKTGLASGMDYAGTNPTAFVDGTDLFFFWINFLFPNSLRTYDDATTTSLAGYYIGIGSSDGNHNWWAVTGSDFARNPYGGWINVAIDPQQTPQFTDGTPTTSVYSSFGFLPNILSAPSRGQSNCADAIRWGRGTIEYTGGAPAGTFTDIATTNDLVANRWGLFTSQQGSYLYKGLLRLGTAASSLLFSDSDKSIFVDDTRKVYASFNRIEIRNSGSNITWENINIVKLKYIPALSFISRGQFEVVDNATVSFTGCSFTDMDTFIFNGGTNPNNLNDTTFRRCNAVTQGGAILDGCTFEESTAVSALVISGTNAADVNNVTNCFFISAGTGNAVDLGTISSSVSRNWDGHSLTGYGTGSTGSVTGTQGSASSAIRVNVNTGITLTINVINGATLPTIQNTGPGTVVVQQNVTIFISITDVSITPISGAQVAIYTITGDIEIFNGQTDVNGEVSTSYSANIPIYIRVRKSTTGSTRYRPIETTGATGATGASFFLTLIEDTFTELII